MTSRDFCYWLQGYFEIDRFNRTNDSGQTVASCFSAEQTECIQKHLAMVFKHEIDTSMGDERARQILSAIHLRKFDPKVNC